MRKYSTPLALALPYDDIRYMFHQANMRVNDIPDTTVNGKKGQYSLLMTWVETITAEVMRL
jgi:hypothetical protein